MLMTVAPLNADAGGRHHRKARYHRQVAIIGGLSDGPCRSPLAPAAALFRGLDDSARLAFLRRLAAAETLLGATGNAVAQVIAWRTARHGTARHGTARHGGRAELAALVLILGGAVANLADRAADGVVTDYLHTGWWPTSTSPTPRSSPALCCSP